MKLRAACLGVKIRAENGLGNALEALWNLVLYSCRSPPPPPPPPLHVPTGTTRISAVSGVTPKTKTQSDVSTEWREGQLSTSPRFHGGDLGEVEGGGVSGSDLEGPDGGTIRCFSSNDELGCVAFRGYNVQEDNRYKLVLREMPNGVSVWSGNRAEEETFFIYGEVFEDRTYAKRALRVREGDTVWDVGK